MEKEQALTIIEQALNIAIGKNTFKTEDSAVVLTAFLSIKNLLSPPDSTKEIVEEKVEIPTKK